MIRRRAALGVALAICVVALAGCPTPEPPTITPKAAELGSVSPLGVTVKLTLEVHNPNGFALTGQSVNAKVTFGDSVTLGPIDIDQKLTLPANKSTEVSVDVKTGWSNAAQFASLAAGKETIAYVVEGTMTVGGKSLNAKVPFEIKGKVTRAEILESGLKGLPSLRGLPGLGK